jgi:hypothetical protein
MGIEKPELIPTNYPINTPSAIRVWRLDRAPVNSKDFKNFKVSDIWIDKFGKDVYMLISKTSTTGDWVHLGESISKDVISLTGDTGGAVGPDSLGNINLIGIAGITTTGNPGSNSITFSEVSWNWQENTVGIISLTNRTGYFANGAFQIQYNLPVTATVGDDYQIVAKSSAGFKVQAGASQTIRMGNQIISSGGDIQSSQIGDIIEIICMTANIEFIVLRSIGNIFIN